MRPFVFRLPADGAALRRLALLLAAGLAILTIAAPASAGLTRAELQSVGFENHSGRPLPGDVVLTDSAGRSENLATRLAGKPALVAFVDYTCRTVCGVAAGALAHAVSGMTMKAGKDFELLVIGFDPRDSSADRAKWLAGNPEAATLGKAAFLQADRSDTRRLVEAAGLKTAYDAERDQFAHPAGALLIDANGRILRVLDLVSLEATTLHYAVVEASEGKAGSFFDRAILCCYGWDAETGRYAPLINFTLTAACVLTVLLIGLFVALLVSRERRRAADAQS